MLTSELDKHLTRHSGWRRAQIPRHVLEGEELCSLLPKSPPEIYRLATVGIDARLPQQVQFLWDETYLY
jgi:hypothetical protein